MIRLSTTLILSGISAHAAAAPAASQSIMPDHPEARKIQEGWGFADAVVSGDTIYLSGVVVGTRPADANLEVAYDRAFARIADILKRAGSSWQDVVDITSYHTDLGTQMERMVAVKNGLGKAPFPAWTAIEVRRLIPDIGITEIKVVAKKSQSSTTQ